MSGTAVAMMLKSFGTCQVIGVKSFWQFSYKSYQPSAKAYANVDQQKIDPGDFVPGVNRRVNYGIGMFRHHFFLIRMLSVCTGRSCLFSGERCIRCGSHEEELNIDGVQMTQISWLECSCNFYKGSKF